MSEKLYKNTELAEAIAEELGLVFEEVLKAIDASGDEYGYTDKITGTKALQIREGFYENPMNFCDYCDINIYEEGGSWYFEDNQEKVRISKNLTGQIAWSDLGGYYVLEDGRYYKLEKYILE